MKAQNHAVRTLSVSKQCREASDQRGGRHRPVPSAAHQTTSPQRSAGSQATAHGADLQNNKAHGADRTPARLQTVARAMSERGFRVDVVALRTLRPELERGQRRLRDELLRRAPTLDPDSEPSIYATLEQHGIDANVLADTAPDTNTGYGVLADLIVDWRRTTDLLDNVNRYLWYARQHGDQRGYRLHATFTPNGARTGRWTAQRPNLHGVPKRGHFGSQIRQAFIGSPYLIRADFSQMEPRILAFLSNDKALRRALSDDLYTALAAELSISRDQAKVVVLALLYGMSSARLAGRLSISPDAAQGLMARMAQSFPQAFPMLDEAQQRAQAGLPVSSFHGRLFVPDEEADRWRRGRQARNFIVQATATEFAESALIAVSDLLRDYPLAGLVNFVHDEVVIESGYSEADTRRLARAVKRAMEIRLPDGQKLLVEVGIGTNWLIA